jgi:hypothetical protein
MAEKLYKICLHCSDTIVEGCESMTEDQVNDWLEENQERLAEPAECGDMQKYVVLQINEQLPE